MKHKLLLLSALLSPVLQADPFISEYVEGSSNNKALELYNPAAVAVDLTGYSIKMYFNGAVSAGRTINLVGTIPAKGTFVLTDSSATQVLKDKSQQSLGTGIFNGDDAIALFKDSTLIDVFGQIGLDPGTGWTSADNSLSTLDRTLVRKASVTKGDTNPDDAFDPSVEWIGFPKDTFDNLGSHTADGGTPEDPPPPPPPTVQIGACQDSASLISAIQGTVDLSPEVGKTLVVEAVVSQVAQYANGFYLQEEAADQDNNAATSEGIFVYNNGLGDYPVVGQKVRVLGQVEEFYNKTQIKRSTMLDCGTGPAITATTLTLPLPSLAAWEAVESMLVRLPQELTVSDTYNLGTYGELTLAPQRLYVPTNQFRPNSPEAIALKDLNSRSTVVLDDLQNGKNPANIIFPAPGLNMNNPVRVGDTVAAIQGIADYSFNAWRILPAAPVQFSASNPRQDTPKLRQQGSLVVAAFNVLNYFNGDGLGGGYPTARGADNAQEFARQAEKTVAAIAAVNADVLGLMEIENDGYGNQSAIVDLVSRLNQRLGAGTYQYVKVPNATQLGTDAITVGLLYKPAKVSPQGVAVTTNTGVFGFGNRQPLVQTFKQLSNNQVFTIAVNHFKSKGSCPGATSPDRDFKDGQGCWTATRVQAATELMNWLKTNPTGSTDPDLLIVGDLNAYAKEDPIVTFTNNGFVNLVEKYQGNRGYSYLFGGESGYLDHALASESLSAQTSYAMEWHINADETTLFDYNLENKTAQQIADFYQPSPFRASDHDPVVVELALQATNPADIDQDGDVDNNDIALFNAMLKSGQPLSLIYDFNKDNIVSSSDARAMTALCTYARCAVK